METNYWVFDTNTLMSALLVKDSVPAKALMKARQKGSILVSTEISQEYIDVFSQPKFDKYISLEIRLAFIENIIAKALAIEIIERITACREPKDDKFPELRIKF